MEVLHVARNHYRRPALWAAWSDHDLVEVHVSRASPSGFLEAKPLKIRLRRGERQEGNISGYRPLITRYMTMYGIPYGEAVNMNCTVYSCCKDLV